MKNCVLMRVLMSYLAQRGEKKSSLKNPFIHCAVLYIWVDLLLHARGADILSIMCLIFFLLSSTDTTVLTSLLIVSGLHFWNSGSQRPCQSPAHYWASVEISCSILSVSLINRFAFSLSGAQIGNGIVGSSVRQKDIPVPETKNRLRISGLYNHLCQFGNIAIAVRCERKARIEAGFWGTVGVTGQGSYAFKTISPTLICLLHISTPSSPSSPPSLPPSFFFFFLFFHLLAHSEKRKLTCTTGIYSMCVC